MPAGVSGVISHSEPALLVWRENLQMWENVGYCHKNVMTFPADFSIIKPRQREGGTNHERNVLRKRLPDLCVSGSDGVPWLPEPAPILRDRPMLPGQGT